MIQTIRHPQPAVWLFLAVVSCVYSAAWLVVGRISSLENADYLAVGLTIDLVVVVPLAFYFLIVRRGGHSFIRVAPVVIVSLMVASVVLPSRHQGALHVLEAIVAPFEIGILGWVVWRTVSALRGLGTLRESDPLQEFRGAAFELLKNHRAAGVFATEISVFYYALFSWRSKPHRLPGRSSFSHHRKSGQAGIVLGFVLLLVVEGFAVHLLLSMWSVLVAWLFTLSTIYGGLWLVSDYRASVLRPILVGDESVLVRGGIRYTVEFPRSVVSSMSGDKPKLGKEMVNLKLVGEPSHWIILSEEVDVLCAYGATRRVRAFGVAPDDPRSFEQALLQVKST